MIAAAFLSGQSSASGSAVLSQAVSSMAGAAQMMAQVGSASRAENRIKESRSERSEMQGMMQSNGQQLGGAGADTLAPAQQGPSFGTGASGADGASGASGAPAVGGSSGTGGATGNISHMTGSNGNGAPRQALGAGFTSNGSGASAPAMPSQRTARQLPSSGTAPTENVAFSPTTQNTMAQNSSQSSLPGSRDLALTSDAPTDGSSSSYADSNPSVPRNLTTGQPMTGPTQSGQRPTNGSIGFGEVQPKDIRRITSKAEANRLASATEWKDLNPDQQKAVMNNQVARDAMFERLNSTEQDARRDEEFAGAYALNGPAQAAPREIGQPSAVQVRISNPNKL